MDFEWNGGDEKIAVVDIWVGDKLYQIACGDYDKAIEEGRTEYITMGEKILMVTPKDYKLLKWALKKIKGE